MKGAHRRKTMAEGNTHFMILPKKRQHNSITSPCIESDMNRLIVFDVIEHLISKTFEEQRQRTQFFNQATTQLNYLQLQNQYYFNLDFQDPPQVICRQDAEPPAQENRSLEVKKVKKLTKTSKHRLTNETPPQIPEGSNGASFFDADKKDRDNIIQKLKKEYSMILQSKYLSESSPIGQSRGAFLECDPPQIVNLRNYFVKKPLKKTQQKHKHGYIENEIRKNKQLKTIFKRSKDFIEIMDPPQSNSVYMSQIQTTNVSHRNSTVNVTPQNEAPVNIKLSKLKEITNSMVSPKSQVISIPFRKSRAQPARNISKMITLAAQQERQALKLRVERSFHSNEKMKFKQIQTQRKPRINNSMSVSFLPRIDRM